MPPFLNDAAEVQGRRHVAIDGKTLRRSFDNFLDRRAAHMLSASMLTLPGVSTIDFVGDPLVGLSHFI
jgi:hypothetical protein